MYNDCELGFMIHFLHFEIFRKKNVVELFWVATAGRIIITVRTIYDACEYCCDLMLCEKIVLKFQKVN